MRLILLLYSFIFIFHSSFTQQQVEITIDVNSENRSVSPSIFGKNNCLSDRPGNPLTAANWQRLRDLGIKMFRENGGNNSSKYNWRRKLSSHPNWYNNVYPHDWDYAAASLNTNIPDAQGMWAFQLIGKAARTMAYNFNDGAYNGSQWWEGVEQNLAGGGQVNPAGGSNALTEGDPSLYLEDWTADSTTGILDKWFGPGGIGLDSTRIRYWSMDNEPEIWSGTHDDIWPVQPDAETFMQNYFVTAKKARAKFPGIKLLGPVPANEWQWYNWNGNKISYKGNQYVWLEYFILRIAEEQQLSGVRLLDVLDIHFYPGETNPADIVQLHRVFFDETYAYPGANGVRRSGPGSWDVSLNKEYILKRCNNWLEQYLGINHGVSLAVSEIGIEGSNSNVTAVWYASTLGEFMKQGVEIFTPWTWKTGMYEVLHLFSRFSKENFVNALSTNELYVSAYPTVNIDKDSMTIYLVNRHLTESRITNLNIKDFPVRDGIYKTYQLHGLPISETFISHTSNALEINDILITGNNLQLQLPPLSVTAIILKRAKNIQNQFGYLVAEAEAENGALSGVSVSQSVSGYSGTGYVTGFDNTGDKVTVDVYIPEKNLFKLVIRFRSPGGQKFQNLLINNRPVSAIRFAMTDTFTSVDAGSYLLEKGINKFTISSSWGYTDIDKFEIYPVSENIFNISSNLADSAANETTKNLYNLLLMQFGERMIAGQTHDYYNTLKSVAGKSPVLRAADFQHFTEGYPYLWKDGGFSFGKHDDGSVNALINWYTETGKKGIISYQWHWHSPTGGEVGTNTFYTSYTTFDVIRAVTPGTQEYEDIIRDIDDIAAELKKFSDADIPVLWRPLHEAGGGWFWWGAKGPEPCKELYNIIFERLKNHHQLHNLIWVWSTPEEEWYPGNDKVDIIGHDSYPGNYNYSNQKFAFDELYRLTNGEKLIAMTENGPIPNPDECFSGDAPWLFFMSWSDLVTQQNSTAHIQDVYNHPDVITIESDNIKTSLQWRSRLYPENWVPGFKDNEGRFLQDFSYAGYQKGENNIPFVSDNIVDVTLPPYNADNTGNENVTAIIQQAIDDVGLAGGGVVFLPAGTYKIKTEDTADFGLRITSNNTVLRGAGPDSTFLFHDETYLRHKSIIGFMGNNANWLIPSGKTAYLTLDLPEPTRILPVESVEGFNAGEHVIITSTATADFIDEHHMSGYWTAQAVKGVAFLRTIDSVDATNNLLILDAPTRYFLKTRDSSRVYHAGTHLSGCGIENLSVGNTQNPKPGWDEESYSTAGTGAYDVHFSHAVLFKNSMNCWVKNVYTYKPPGNTEDIHILSNCLLLDQCRFITVDSCFFQKPQYEGGGGNGYMYTLQSNDCLVKNSAASHSRHNFDFKYPYSNGNVIHRCRAENSKYASDFHMYLSMSNLFDECVINGDYLESSFRPYGGEAIHGYTSTQSVFYNTHGEAYHPGKDYMIESRQFGNGYVIGTSGPAFNVLVNPVEGILNGYYFNTAPRDFTEGIGKGEHMVPQSLYLDQLQERLSGHSGTKKFNVTIIVKDEATNEFIPGCKVTIYNEIKITGDSGQVFFNNVLEVFVLEVENNLYLPAAKRSFVIFSDTSLTIYMNRKEFNVNVKLYNSNTSSVITGTAITIGTHTITTNTAGEAAFKLFGGVQNYSVSKIYFQTASGTLNIASDTIISIFLIQELAYVKFRLYENNTPVNNALIRLNNDSLISNSLGIVNFLQLTVPAAYTFEIFKDGYSPLTGDFYLKSDTTINLYMELSIIESVMYQREYSINLWPNPVKEHLNCTFSGGNTKKIIQIKDIYGKEIDLLSTDQDDFSINVKDYPSGIYIFGIMMDEKMHQLVFVKL